MDKDKTGNPIQDMTADGPVELSPEDARAAMKTIVDLNDSIRFLYEKVQTNHLSRSDVKTHLGLLRFAFNDLNKLMDGNIFLNDKLEETTAMLRQANQELRALRENAGFRINAQTGSAFIQNMAQAAITWYELSGFRYASRTFYPWSIQLEFSSEIKFSEGAHARSGMKDLAAAAAAITPYQFGPSSGYDLQKDGYHMELLDTDNNKNNIRSLFTGVFPHSQVTDFRSQLDRNLYLLRPTVNIPYEDIEAWVTATGFTQAETDKQEG